MPTTLLRPYSLVPLGLGLDDAPFPFSPFVPTLMPRRVSGDCKTLLGWVREQRFAAIEQSLVIEETLDATWNCIWIYANLIDFDLEIEFVDVYLQSPLLAERAEHHTESKRRPRGKIMTYETHGVFHF